MAWFKVNDRLPSSRKILGIPRSRRTAAVGLWTLAGAWSSAELTDGQIPEFMIDELGGSRKMTEDLVNAGLWDRTEDGYAFHDWLDWQPDAASVKARHEAESAAGSKGNHLRWHMKRGVRDPSCEYCKPSGGASGTRSGADQVTRIPSDSGANPPVPVPVPIPPTVGADGQSDDATETTQTLVAEWIDHCEGGRPPGDVVGQIAKRVGQMLDEGIPYRDVRRGLQQWQDKGLHPSTLPSVVHEVRTAKPRKPRRQAETDDLFARAAARLGATSDHQEIEA